MLYKSIIFLHFIVLLLLVVNINGELEDILSNVDIKLEQARELILKYCEPHEHEHDHKDSPDGKPTSADGASDASKAPGGAVPTDASAAGKRKKQKGKAATLEDKIVDQKAGTDASVATASNDKKDVECDIKKKLQATLADLKRYNPSITSIFSTNLELLLAQPTHDCSQATDFITKLRAENWTVQFEIQNAVPDFSGYTGEDVSLQGFDKAVSTPQPLATSDSADKKADGKPTEAVQQKPGGESTGETVAGASTAGAVPATKKGT